MKNLKIKNNGDDTYFVSYEKVHKIEGKETTLTVEFPKVDISFGNHEFLCSREEGFTKSLELLVDMVAYPGGKNNVICNLIRQTEDKGGLHMEKVVLPKEVANAIEKVWSDCNKTMSTKHLVLTNWSLLHEDCSDVVDALQDYATKNPIKYMRALVEGYDVEETPQETIERLEKVNRDMRTEFKLLNMLDIDDITNKDYTDRDKLFQVMEYVHEASSKYCV